MANAYSVMTTTGIRAHEQQRRSAPRSHAKTNASKQDLRVWLAEMEAAGEVTRISGAEREREIGAIVDIYQRKIGNPAVLFDDIPGYPKGLASSPTSSPRTAAST